MLALTMVELKQAKQQLEAKEAEMAQAEQPAYDAGMNKTAKSLTTQFQDVARAFNRKVWGEAMNAAGVDHKSELHAPNKVYYLSALRLAPTAPPPLADSSSAPTSVEPQGLPSSPSSSKGIPPQETIVEVEAKEGILEGT